MKTLGAAVAAVGFSFAAFQAPAQAASPMTDAFLANVAANLSILDASSRMARSQTGSAAIVAYAADETSEAKQVATALAEATPAGHRASSQVADADGVMTGRSVAVVGMTGRVEPAVQSSVLEAANSRTPATADLAKLRTVHGRAFDKLYFVLQLDALSQIESDYRTYISEGDDPAVATMAHQQLPGLMRRLEALTRI